MPDNNPEIPLTQMAGVAGATCPVCDSYIAIGEFKYTDGQKPPRYVDVCYECHRDWPDSEDDPIAGDIPRES